MNETAAALFAEMGGRRPADVERALEMDVDHRVPFLFRHFMENDVAQDAGVVNHDVQPTELVDGLGDHRLAGGEIGDTAEIGLGFAAGVADFLDDFQRRLLVGALAGGGAAQIVDDHFGAIGRHHNRHIAADATAGTGDQGGFPVKKLALAHPISPGFSRVIARACFKLVRVRTINPRQGLSRAN